MASEAGSPPGFFSPAGGNSSLGAELAGDGVGGDSLGGIYPSRAATRGPRHRERGGDPPRLAYAEISPAMDDLHCGTCSCRDSHSVSSRFGGSGADWCALPEKDDRTRKPAAPSEASVGPDLVEWAGSLVDSPAADGTRLRILIHFFQQGVFFSKTALVTFGGAYAIFALCRATGRRQAPLARLRADDDRPRPRGDNSRAAYHGSSIRRLCRSVAAPGRAFSPRGRYDPERLSTTWSTFLPGMLLVLLGAPYVERARGVPALNGALSGISAAVVGVILNLALWFGVHLIFSATRQNRLSFTRNRGDAVPPHPLRQMLRGARGRPRRGVGNPALAARLLKFEKKVFCIVARSRYPTQLDFRVGSSMVEQRPFKALVLGSSPSRPTSLKPL